MAKSFTVILILAAIGTAAAAGILFIRSGHSSLAFNQKPAVIGTATPVTVHVTNPRGVRSVSAIIEQDGVTTQLMEVKVPAAYLTFRRRSVPDQDYRFVAGKSTVRALKEGKARIVFKAQSNDLRGLTDNISADVQVVLRPATITADGFQHYINQGGSELVILSPAGSWSETGVRVRNNTFRSFPSPAGSNQRFALFAFPWDESLDTVPIAYVKDAAGMESTARFWFKIFPKKFRKRDIDIDDKFLTKVDDEIDPNGSGDLLSRFLKINGELRVANNKTISDLRLKTENRFLWTQSFLQLANSKVESQFADVRTYVYKGKKVDQQVHLGFDLAVGQHTPVVAANDGKVVWAARLGIYGNCIVVDHGYGLQSIYGHLSEIAVKEGEMVRRGQAMGKSGATGLASGDHLHFSMQIDGVQVNPIEWWDEHWINDHVRSRVNAQ